MREPTAGPFVFVSYSHIDRHLAEQIAADLSVIGIDYFLDSKDIAWGESISHRVADALQACTHQIIILSPASIESAWVHFETGHAIGSGKVALPFLTHPSLRIPQYLRDMLWVGDRDSLREYFEKESKQLPTPEMRAVELVNYADAYSVQARYQEALRFARLAIAADPKYEFGYVQAMSALRQLGRYEDASSLATEALNAIPGSGVIQQELAFLLRSMGRFQEAIEVYSRVLHLDPDYYNARYYRADCLQRLGQADEAVREYKLVLDAAAKSADVHRWSRQRIKLLETDSPTSDRRDPPA